MPLGDALHGLIVLVIVILASVFAGSLFRRFSQPAVLGPIAIGIAAGTALAASSHGVRSALLPAASRSLIETAGTAGLLLLMFSVGSELRLHGANSPVRRANWQILPCVLVPMSLGAAAAWPFAHRLAGDGSGAHLAWLFVGLALGITAVPVLVLVMRDLSIANLPIAQTALRISVATDAVAWLLVTLLIIIAADTTTLSLAAMLVGAGIMAVVVVVTPRVVRRYDGFKSYSTQALLMCAGALAGGTGTQVLGLHPAIGAIIAGYFVPSRLTDPATQRAFSSVVNLLLPAFFVASALSVPLQTLSGQADWGGLVCFLTLTATAFISKLTVGYLFGRLQGSSRPVSGQLGVLLNCRGVTEIAIASVGFQAHLVSAYGFAVLCTLAILTTAVTVPLYRLCEKWSRPANRAADRVHA